jgi:hypothetical protein
VAARGASSQQAPLQLAAAWAENLRKRVRDRQPDVTSESLEITLHHIQLTILGVLKGHKADWLPQANPSHLRCGMVSLPPPQDDIGPTAGSA